MDEQTDIKTIDWTDRQMVGQKVRQMDGWTNGQTGILIDGW